MVTIYTSRFKDVAMHIVFMDFLWFSVQTAIISLKNITQLRFVMVKSSVLFEARNEFRNKLLFTRASASKGKWMEVVNNLVNCLMRH
jgi:hypothetical protein